MSDAARDFAVEYEDGTVQTVRVDQRDWQAFELEYRVGTARAMNEMTMTAFRAACFYALRRTGQIPGERKRKEWDATVIEAMPADDDEEELPKAGSPDPFGEPSSKSPSLPDGPLRKSPRGNRRTS